MKTIVITGGGSGGHLAPARAVIPFLQKKYQTIWIGSSHFEQDTAKNLGISFFKIFSGKMRRGKNLKNFLRNARDFLLVLFAFFQSIFLLKKNKTEKIFSTGGFVSVPVVLAAAVLHIPIFIHEQTIGFGLANKITLPFVKKVLLAFEDSKKYIPKKYHHKVEVVGNPIREDLLNGEQARLEKFLGRSLKEKPVLYVTGGGQGSQLINKVIFSLLPKLTEKYVVIHQAGKKGITEAQKQSHENYFPFAFIGDELADIYASASVVVARAGAGTVNELAFFDIPSIFIPLRPTQNDEQTKNAEWFLRNHRGKIIEQEALNEEILLDALKTLEREVKEEKKKSKKEKVRKASLSTPSTKKLLDFLE